MHPGKPPPNCQLTPCSINPSPVNQTSRYHQHPSGASQARKTSLPAVVETEQPLHDAVVYSQCSSAPASGLTADCRITLESQIVWNDCYVFARKGAVWFKYAAGVATPVQWNIGVDWNTVCDVAAAAVGALWKDTVHWQHNLRQRCRFPQLHFVR